MIRCRRIRRFAKNTLKAFVDLELTRVGLIIHDCCWRTKGDREWVGFPARSYEDKNGARQWNPILEFTQDATKARDQFQKQALEAIHEAAAAQTEAS